MGNRGSSRRPAGLVRLAAAATLLTQLPAPGQAIAPNTTPLPSGIPPLAPPSATAGDPAAASGRCPTRQAVRAAASPPPAQAAPTRTAEASPLDYRQAIRLTPWGAARLPHWCVWIEPHGPEGPDAPLTQRWRQAVEAALARWAALVPITRVSEPERAQLLLLRQRPPLRSEPDGRLRASHGRAELTVLEVQRDDRWRLEPSLRVLISPGQRQQAIQATALHELGHAFGLWGHSPDPRDAMAAVPGPSPVLELSRRDRATLEWLRQQPSRFGQPVSGD